MQGLGFHEANQHLNIESLASKLDMQRFVADSRSPLGIYWHWSLYKKSLHHKANKQHLQIR